MKPLGYGRRVPTEENCKPPVMYARPGALFLFMSGKHQIIYFFLLKTFCAQASCQNNGTRQSGFTRKRYRCLCASGFTGHDCEKGNTCVIETNFWFYHSGLFLQKVQDSESVVLMTHTKYDPSWVKRRMGAQVQFSCSFSQLWLSVCFVLFCFWTLNFIYYTSVSCVWFLLPYVSLQSNWAWKSLKLGMSILFFLWGFSYLLTF